MAALPRRSTAAPMDFERSRPIVASSVWLMHANAVQEALASQRQCLPQSQSQSPSQPQRTRSLAFSTRTTGACATSAGDLFSSVSTQEDNLYHFGQPAASTTPKKQSAGTRNCTKTSRHKRRRTSSSSSSSSTSHTSPHADQQVSRSQADRSLFRSTPRSLSSIIILVLSRILTLVRYLVPLTCLILVLLPLFSDIRKRLLSHSISHAHQISACRDNYHRNKCYPSDRVPALESMCSDWELCMSTEGILGAGYISVFMEVASSSVESFLSGLSLRSMVFLSVLVVFASLSSRIGRVLGKLLPGSSIPPNLELPSSSFSPQKSIMPSPVSQSASIAHNTHHQMPIYGTVFLTSPIGMVRSDSGWVDPKHHHFRSLPSRQRPSSLLRDADDQDQDLASAINGL